MLSTGSHGKSVEWDKMLQDKQTNKPLNTHALHFNKENKRLN